MKKLVYLLGLLWWPLAAGAQLANGSTVPDFTFTDLSGHTQNLYSYLNQGKIVALEVATTWCDPCWTYHKSLALDSLYEMHDAPGDNQWRVLFLEGDGYTDSLDLAGLRPASKGNWLEGTRYPIINPPTGPALDNFTAAFHIAFYPTLYLICPNKKVFQDTLNFGNRPTVSTWEYIARYCGPAGIDDLNDQQPLSIYPNPAHSQVTLYFGLNAAQAVTATLTNQLGQVVLHTAWGRQQPGDQALPLDVSHIAPGIYFLALRAGERTVYQKLAVQ